MCPVCGEEGCNDSTVFDYCVVCGDGDEEIEDRHYPLVCAECAGDRARWDDEVGQEEIITIGPARSTPLGGVGGLR